MPTTRQTNGNREQHMFDGFSLCVAAVAGVALSPLPLPPPVEAASKCNADRASMNFLSLSLALSRYIPFLVLLVFSVVFCSFCAWAAAQPQGTGKQTNEQTEHSVSILTTRRYERVIWLRVSSAALRLEQPLLDNSSSCFEFSTLIAVTHSPSASHSLSLHAEHRYLIIIITP